MKRTIAIFLSLLMVSFSIVSCSNKEDPNNETTSGTDETTAAPENIDKNEVYSKFDLDTYMNPIWDGNIVYNETVMFIGQNDKIPLLYTADEIISLRSYDLKTEYKKGIDYDYVDGYLVALEGTSMPVIPEDKYFDAEKGENGETLLINHNGKDTFIYCDDLTKWQLAVTYKHSGTWQNYMPECASDKFTNVINKLNNGEDVTILFCGDSITHGATTSGHEKVAPYMPPYSRLVTSYLAKNYSYKIRYIDTTASLPLTFATPAKDEVYGDKGTITYINTAVGGYSSRSGFLKYDSLIKPFIEQYGCDLFILGFGMNDGKSTVTSESVLIKKILDKVVEQKNDVEMLIISTMVPNPNAIDHWNENQSTFEPGLVSLAKEYTQSGTPCAVVCMTSMTLSVLKTKRFDDISANNINHPNDFLQRLYAQVFVETLVGYKNLNK